MGNWIKRQKIGNRTFTQNMRTGSVRITTTTKRNKNSSGPTTSLSNSTKGKSYRTESYKSGGMTKRSRTTLFSSSKGSKTSPKVKKTPTAKSKPLRFSTKNSGAMNFTVVKFFLVGLAVVVASILLMVNQ